MKITPNDPPRTLTAAEIEAILPHRSPFALVDKITDYTRPVGARHQMRDAHRAVLSGAFPRPADHARRADP